MEKLVTNRSHFFTCILPVCGLLLLSVPVYSGTQQNPEPPPGAPAPAVPAALPRAASAEEVERLQTELAHSRKILLDWANLNRYREANATLPPLESGQDRVVFMGDSITDGWDAGTDNSFPESHT